MNEQFDVTVAKPIVFKLTKRKAAPALRGRFYPMVKRIPSLEEIYDPNKKVTRTIRYAQGESSIFKDEQPKEVVLADIIFQNGSLIVDGMNPNLMKFLELSNHNADNPYRIKGKDVFFKKLDPEGDAGRAMDAEVEQIQASNIVIQMDFDELKSLARVLGVSLDQSPKEIKHHMLVKAKKNPKAFMSLVDDPVVGRQQVILDALEIGIISMNARTINWKVGDSKGVITPVPVGRKPVEFLAEWSMTDKEGEKVFEDIKKRVQSTKE